LSLNVDAYDIEVAPMWARVNDSGNEIGGDLVGSEEGVRKRKNSFNHSDEESGPGRISRVTEDNNAIEEGGEGDKAIVVENSG
jgi:hypothetical protein